MAVDEASRLRLYDSARRALGEDEATTLMDGLAPAGFDWTSLATKSDLKEMETRFDAKLDALDVKLDAKIKGAVGSLEVRMLERISSQTRSIMLAIVASNATLVGLVLGVVNFAA